MGCSRFGRPQLFFERFFVANYCPLAFMERSGRNFTPDKLPRAERAALFAVCDRALARTVDALRPRIVVGIGKFAAERAAAALQRSGVGVGSAPHPSPASPAANRGWAAQMDGALRSLGVDIESAGACA